MRQMAETFLKNTKKKENVIEFSSCNILLSLIAPPVTVQTNYCLIIVLTENDK